MESVLCLSKRFLSLGKLNRSQGTSECSKYGPRVCQKNYKTSLGVYDKEKRLLNHLVNNPKMTIRV